jgi:hypothetical protein
MAETDGVEEIERAQEIVERVAAIDIAKAFGMVCVRTPHEDKPRKCVSGSSTPSRPAEQSWTWPTT